MENAVSKSFEKKIIEDIKTELNVNNQETKVHKTSTLNILMQL